MFTVNYNDILFSENFQRQYRDVWTDLLAQVGNTGISLLGSAVNTGLGELTNLMNTGIDGLNGKREIGKSIFIPSNIFCIVAELGPD